MEAERDDVETRLRDAGLIVATPRAGVERYELTPKALDLLVDRERIEGRDACEVVLEGGRHAELLIVMSRAIAADGLSLGPGGRGTLVYTVMEFADRDWQRQLWIEQNGPPDVVSDCPEAVDDFAMFGEAPESLIGRALHSGREVEAVAELWARIRAAIRAARDRGIDGYDFERMYQLPEWDDVVMTARHALAVLAEHATGEPKRA